MFYKWLDEESCFAFLEYGPEGFTEIADEDYQQLLLAQEGGKIIAKGPDGEPVAAMPPAPDAAALLTAATVTQRQLIDVATQEINILTDATDPDIVATVDPNDVTNLKLWKQYRVALSKVDLTGNPVAWPAVPAGGANV